MATPMSTTITTQNRTIDGLSIRYAESESDHDKHVLLTNPWPENLYAYHSLWPAFSQHAHLFAGRRVRGVPRSRARVSGPQKPAKRP